MSVDVAYYEDTETEIPTVFLGEGDVIISTLLHNDDCLAGVGFSRKEKGPIGEDLDHLKGKTLPELDFIFQVLSSSKESLIVLRNRIDDAIENWPD